MKRLMTAALTLLSSAAYAGSCCGSKLSFPALLLGEEKAQITGTFLRSSVSDEVLSNGKWLKRRDGNLTQSFKLDAAGFFNETWQGGISIPVIEKATDRSAANQGLGDIGLFLGHVTFPEKTYSYWEPRGITFLQLTLPTGNSLYDSNVTDATLVRGRGFYSLGAGIIFKKSWVTWDASLSSEVHKSFARNADQPSLGGAVEVAPGWGLSQSLGVGWNYGDWRIGSTVSALFEEPIRLSGATDSEGSEQQHFTLSLSGSYMLTSTSAFSVSYSDQSLLGKPVNTSLAKSIQLTFQQRFYE